MSDAIEIDNASFSYGREPVLQNISFNIKSGDFIAIAGPNGTGKSTLLNLLCGLLHPAGGQIRIYGRDIRNYSIKNLAQKVAMVHQESFCAFDFTVLQVVAMARTAYMPALGFETKQDREIIAEAMEMTGIMQFASRSIRQLSAGERQRVFIARALAQQTPILLLDEPTTFLDLKHQVGIYDLLKTAQIQQGKTIVAVTHDINMAAQYCDIIALLATDKTYKYGNPRDVLSEEFITQVFGVQVFSGKVDQEQFFVPLGKLAKYSSKSSINPNLT